MHKKPIIILIGGIVVLAILAIPTVYLYDHRDRVLADLVVNNLRRIRVVEIAPRGRIQSDYLFYRAELFLDGALWSAASYTLPSYKAKEAKISVKGDDTFVSLDGEPIFKLVSEQWEVAHTDHY